jgi:hypothetical protein
MGFFGDALGGFGAGKALGGFGGLFDDLFNNAAIEEPRKLNKRAQQLSQAFKTALPSLTKTTLGQIDKSDTALTQSILKSFPQLAEAQRRQSLTDQQANLGLATEDIRTLAGLDREISPEFFQTLQPRILQESLGLLDKPLTGGEEAAIERALNKENVRTGTQFTPNQATTVANATLFGNAARDRFTQALGNLEQIAPLYKNATPSPFRQLSTPQGPSIQQPVAGQLAQSISGQTLGQLGETQRLGIEAATQAPSSIERLFGMMPDYS